MFSHNGCRPTTKSPICKIRSRNGTAINAESTLCRRSLRAQTMPCYQYNATLQDGYKIGGWDWRYTLAVMACACLFQAGAIFRDTANCVCVPFRGARWQSSAGSTTIAAWHKAPTVREPGALIWKVLGDARFGSATTWQAVAWHATVH